MDDEQVWTAIDEQRRRVVALLESVTDPEWDHPSLCAGWTVRHVGAHLTLQELTLGDALRFALRHPALLRDVNRVIHESAKLQAAELSTDDIVAGVRATVGRRRHNVGVTHRETLVDIVVHGFDIAVPLRRRLDVPPEVAAEAAARVRSLDGTRMNRVFRKLPLAPYRLVATDVDWSVGAGPEIRGPVVALLLLLTGRRVGLDEVAGDGADALRRELVPA
jgi:uncharacterized protein (TIGR03083 family)